jgi:hypothetical protein
MFGLFGSWSNAIGASATRIMTKRSRLAITIPCLIACFAIVSLSAFSYFHGINLPFPGTAHADVRLGSLNVIGESHDATGRRLPLRMQDITAIPLWMPALLFGVVALIPWVKRRFALRSLLIAVTLIALALGVMSLSW